MNRAEHRQLVRERLATAAFHVGLHRVTEGRGHEYETEPVARWHALIEQERRDHGGNCDAEQVDDGDCWRCQIEADADRETRQRGRTVAEAPVQQCDADPQRETHPCEASLDRVHLEQVQNERTEVREQEQQDKSAVFLEVGVTFGQIAAAE